MCGGCVLLGPLQACRKAKTNEVWDCEKFQVI